MPRKESNMTQFRSADQNDILDHGLVKCYICRKKLSPDMAVAVGNDLFRCDSHKASTVRKAAQRLLASKKPK
jgi:hypothetical protein